MAKQITDIKKNASHGWWISPNLKWYLWKEHFPTRVLMTSKWRRDGTVISTVASQSDWSSGLNSPMRMSSPCGGNVFSTRCPSFPTIIKTYIMLMSCQRSHANGLAEFRVWSFWCSQAAAPLRSMGQIHRIHLTAHIYMTSEVYFV